MIIRNLKIVCVISVVFFFYSLNVYSASESQDFELSEGTFDEQFVEISKRLPGFAGAFFDEYENFVIVVSKDSEYKQPEDITQALLNSKTNIKLPVLDDLLESTSEYNLIVQEAAYDFVSLHTWRMAISKEIMSDPNVIFIDTNERENRVVIGVEDIKGKEQYLASISVLNIPHDAVVIKKTAPILKMLRNVRRPIGNGLQIDNAIDLCTLGVNVRYWKQNHWTYAFLTNAHCTNNMHQVTGTVFGQPYKQNQRIGTEIVNAPEIFANCPAGRRCYYVDGALVEYDPGVQLQGKVSRTAYWNPACTTNSNDCPIDAQNPSAPVSGVNTHQYVGQVMNKVGRSTGWTDGVVSETCVDVNSTNSVTFLCQNSVSKAPGAPATNILMGGDSGAPVFKIVGSNVYISGLLWGGIEVGNNSFSTWYYAPWSSVIGAFNHTYTVSWGYGVIWQN